jgi:TIR domain
MARPEPKFQLPIDTEHYLGILSKLYKSAGESQKLAIIVNAQVQVIEQWNHDNWNGGIDGHALFLTISQEIYLSVLDTREQIQSDMCADLNKLHNSDSEFFAEVRLEMVKQTDADWRLDSGALELRSKTILPAVSKRIWNDSGYRVFLSHKSEVKTETAALKASLKLFGISCFVAHEDIVATKEWQTEIESALQSMDAFVALLTGNFHESEWTDQEVGYAVARGVPIIAVKLGRDPYGFIGKFQALRSSWDEAPVNIAQLLITKPKMLDAYRAALFLCSSYDDGNILAKLLPSIESLTVAQADGMMHTYNTNLELSGSFGFNGSRSAQYGYGLVHHLSRATGKNYVMSDSWTITRV